MILFAKKLKKEFMHSINRFQLIPFVLWEQVKNSIDDEQEIIDKKHLANLFML